MPTTLTPPATRLRRADAVTPAVAVRGVTRRFGKKHALNGVSLQVDRGTVHALLGPNGAGKTTLLRILTGLLKPSSGDLAILGQPLGGRTLQSRIGFIPAGHRSFHVRISG